MAPQIRSRSLFSLAFTAVALVSQSIADDVYVFNYCDYPVYLREVVSGTDTNDYHPYDDNAPDIVMEPGDNFTSNFYWPDLGVSIKLAQSPWVPYFPQPPVTQLEYTWEPATGDLWYDISEIDCWDSETPGHRGADCPFFPDGFVLRSERECNVLKCPPEDLRCEDAYITPYDDWETNDCTVPNPGLYAYLCPNAVQCDAMDQECLDNASLIMFDQTPGKKVKRDSKAFERFVKQFDWESPSASTLKPGARP